MRTPKMKLKTFNTFLRPPVVPTLRFRSAIRLTDSMDSLCQRESILSGEVHSLRSSYEANYHHVCMRKIPCYSVRAIYLSVGRRGGHSHELGCSWSDR